MERAKEIKRRKKLRAFRELKEKARKIYIPDDFTVRIAKEEMNLGKP
ncbi:hypothetical protein BCF55_0741 [Hydrogenivirga caldilitoris]|uniref:Uncharacterized protein n=1 Tax=Hydrogenivirga caldilitoris TaxID=246264 RepID=A0A497XNC6_9AQUI|nr:hypothetical protein [Hydrogenivirga caldilitoris]RLJ70466.1 hypothetical protein BCF55_0741 [Hydrogenivirga caldilitoris]